MQNRLPESHQDRIEYFRNHYAEQKIQRGRYAFIALTNTINEHAHHELENKRYDSALKLLDLLIDFILEENANLYHDTIILILQDIYQVRVQFGKEVQSDFIFLFKNIGAKLRLACQTNMNRPLLYVDYYLGNIYESMKQPYNTRFYYERILREDNDAELLGHAIVADVYYTLSYIYRDLHALEKADIYFHKTAELIDDYVEYSDDNAKENVLSELSKLELHQLANAPRFDESRIKSHSLSFIPLTKHGLAHCVTVVMDSLKSCNEFYQFVSDRLMNTTDRTSPMFVITKKSKTNAVMIHYLTADSYSKIPSKTKNAYRFYLTKEFQMFHRRTWQTISEKLLLAGISIPGLPDRLANYPFQARYQLPPLPILSRQPNTYRSQATLKRLTEGVSLVAREPVRDPWTQEWTYTYVAEVANDNNRKQPIGSITLYGSKEVCRSFANTRNNILHANGTFSVAFSNGHKISAICRVLPFTLMDTMQHAAGEGAIHALIRGTANVFAHQVLPYQNEKVFAKLIGNWNYFTLYFIYRLCIHANPENEIYTALNKSFTDTTYVAAANVIAYGAEFLVSAASQFANKNQWKRTSQVLDVVKNGMGFMVFGCHTKPDSYLSKLSAVTTGALVQSAIQYCGNLRRR